MTLAENFTVWFAGNEAACDFATCLWQACHEWDDLEDEGKCDHNSLIAWMAFDKDFHPFYSAHASLLQPAMMGMFLSWTAANVLDREPAHIAQAYMLRAGIYQVWHLMAWICGGREHAVKVGPSIFRFYGEHETLDMLKEEFA
jgi:hypothetical protein